VKGLTVVAKGVGKKLARANVADAGNVKPDGKYSKPTDPADTFRSPKDKKLRADTEHSQQTGTFVKNEGRNNPVHKIKSGGDANKPGAEKHGDKYKPEHVPNKSVVLTDFPKDKEMVHVFNVDPRRTIDSQKAGEWVMPKSEITRANGSMMSAAEIQQKFSLPDMPTHIVDVKPTRAVQATVSTAAGKLPENGGAANHFGAGGGQQWRIQGNKEDLPVDWFENPRPL